MSQRTIAAARQKEMKTSIAVVTTMTCGRGAARDAGGGPCERGERAAQAGEAYVRDGDAVLERGGRLPLALVERVGQPAAVDVRVHQTYVGGQRFEHLRLRLCGKRGKNELRGQ